MSENITVNGKLMAPQEFKDLKETIQKDPKKMLKEVKPQEYKVLEKMNG